MKEQIKELLKTYSLEEIENSSIQAFLDHNHLGPVFKNDFINKKIKHINHDCYHDICKNIAIKDLNILNIFFESLLTEKEKIENGIVFTPLYICDYIIKNTIKNFDNTTRIIEPSCGCGIFIISTLNYLKKKTKKSVIELLENHIYGIDIKEKNIERTKIILTLYAILNGEDVKKINFNFLVKDSLFNDWSELFHVDKFDYIIGNPPYINNHDLKKEYIEKLSTTFQTTTEGTFNIFYAFIEKSMDYLSEAGKLGFIIPNNFIHIQSAKSLRRFIKENHYLNTIIDFKDNTIFFPILTYNCILYLTHNNKQFKFAKIEKKEDFQSIFQNIELKETSITTLNDNGWELVDEVVKNNIIKIQSFRTKLDPYIRVGIATLRDKIYILDGFDEEKNMYYKWMNHTKIYIEPDITIPYIKISQYKNEKNLKRIIFPYIIENNNSIPIQPKEMKTKYPMAFQYFKSVKDDLKDRATEKKVNAEMWYLYGRSQGLNLWNNKILFSTFNENPDFFLCENNKVLFSNGYCITNFDLDEEVLLKIINSKIMKYFIDNISYSISGNYKCYQKKYVKNFSIPDLSHKDIIFLKTCNNRNEIDDYLIRLYDLKNI